MYEAPNIWAWATHPIYLYTDTEISIRFVFFTATHLCVCFILLGVCASDYLCPIVVKLTNHNTNSHKGILAAILLACCNSSPDLLSNLMSWNSTNNAAALSIGEVLGACGVIICVVQGAIFMVMKSAWTKLTDSEKRSITIDLLFTLISVCIVGYVCLINSVSIPNCILMLFVYVAYIVFKILTSNSKAVMNKTLAAPIPKDSKVQEVLDAYYDIKDPRNQHFVSDIETGIKSNKFTSIDYNSLFTLMDYNSFVKVIESSGSITNTDTISLETMDIAPMYFRPHSEPNNRCESSNVLASAQTAPATLQLNKVRSESPYKNISHPLASSNIIKQKIQCIYSSIVYVLAPQLASFSEKNRFSQITTLILMPFVMLLRISIPQYSSLFGLSFDGNSLKLPKGIFEISTIHSILAPLTTILLIMSFTEKIAPWPFWILSSLVSAVLLFSSCFLYNQINLVNTFSLTSPGFPKIINRIKLISKSLTLAFNILGVCCSILWISYLANTLIELMVIYQRLIHISEAILGLTIFSWGNSISDLMSNVSMAKLYHKIPTDDSTHVDTKFLTISLGACLGGVLLNTMVGIGLSGLIAMAPAKKWSIVLRDEGIDKKFLVSAGAIIIQILFLLWLFLANPHFLHFRMKTVGLSMCIWWLSATFLNLLLEILY